MAKRNWDQINYQVLRLLTRYRGKPQYYTTSWIAEKLQADYKNTKDILHRMHRQELIHRIGGIRSPAYKWSISAAGLVLVKFYIRSGMFKEKNSGRTKHLQTSEPTEESTTQTNRGPGRRCVVLQPADQEPDDGDGTTHPGKD